MLIEVGQQLLDPEYGPKIFVDGGLKEKYRSVQIDADVLGENLQTDFPELDQSDWDNSIVCVTDKLHRRFGGMSINALIFRNRSARFLHSVQREVSSLLSPINSPQHPSAKWILAAAKGHEVLTVLNLSANRMGRHYEDAFFNPENPIGLSNILAHELHHTTGQLFDNRVYRENEDAVRTSFNRVARRVAVIGAGGTAAVGGFFEAVGSTADGAIPHLYGVGVMATGLTLAGTALHRAIKSDSSPLRTAELDLPDPSYGRGEECAQAYALATSEKWSGVVTF